MIRAAFLGVLVLAGLLAYGGFALVKSGGSGVDIVDTAPDVETPSDPETATRQYFLADQDLGGDDISLILYGAGPSSEDMVVTDAQAIRAAKDLAWILADPTLGEVAGSVVVAMMGVSPQQRIATLYRGEDFAFHVTCGSMTCGDFAGGDTLDYAGLLDVAKPLIRVEDTFDDYTDYLDALSAIAADPDFALLGLLPATDQTHPVAQTEPRLTLALPTIYKSAAEPLDTESYSAQVSAVIAQSLPDGATVASVTVTDMGNAILVDADNSRPALQGGAEIVFPDVQFYSQTAQISGVADLSDDSLDAITTATLQRIDWDDPAATFIQSLGLECADCFEVQVKGDTYDAARVILRIPESYYIPYYDLRDPP